MGASQSKHQKKIITINHEKFNNVQSITATDTIMLQIPIKNQEDYLEWEKKIQRLQGFDSQMYLFPLSLKYDPRKLCGESGGLSIQYDSYPFILLDEITNRTRIRKYFDEAQMWYLLFCLVSASHFFNSLNSKVGDIQPKNIFINQMGQIKVSTVFSWPCEEDNLSKTEKYGIVTYLAPQQMQMLKTKKMDTLLNFQISQCFSIGMTMLHAGLLNDLKNLYQLETLTFNKRKFNQYAQEWKNLCFKVEKESLPISYSTQLKEAVLGLCQFDPHQRVSSSLLYSWMEKYIDNIVNLKAFKIGKPPVKNHLNNHFHQHNQYNRQLTNTAKDARSMSHVHYTDNYLQKNNLIYQNQLYTNPSNNNKITIDRNNLYPRNFSNQKIDINYNNSQPANREFLLPQVRSNNPRDIQQRPPFLFQGNERTGAISPIRNQKINFGYDQSNRFNKLY